MKVIVLAGGYDQIALIKELKKRVEEVVLIDYYSNPPAKKYADRHYQVSTLDIEAVKNIAITEKVDLITTACTDQALLTVAKVSEELGLPCYISYETALNVTNKYYMKDKMLKNDIPTSKYIITNTKDEVSLSSLKFPVVVKPVDCNSSKGVKKVESMDTLKLAISEALKLSRNGMAIIEEFKLGNEISVDVYINDGKVTVLSMTESEKIKNKNSFTIYRSKYPIQISDEVKVKINIIAKKISEVFGLKNGPLLIQVISDGKDVDVLEFSARMGGGTKYKLIESITGINIMKVYVDFILGKKINLNGISNVKFAHLNYCYCNPGTFDRLDNFEKLKNEKVIYDYFQYKTKGMRIESAETSSDRVAGYLIVAKNHDELIYKEKIANNQLKIISDNGDDLFLRNIF